MKTEIITEQKKDFEPFTVSITAETIQDARLLFHVCNHAELRDILVQDISYWEGHYNSSDLSDIIGRGISSQVRKIVESQGYEI